MEVTAPPWSRWRRRHRIRYDPMPRDEYWLGPRLNLYTGRYQRPGEQLSRPIIRFEDGMDTRIIFPTPRNPWLQHQFPIDTEPWRLSVPLPPELKTFRQDPISVESDVKPTLPPARHHWTDSALGWAAGTVLLAMFVLLVRAAEKCLDRRLFKSRRRQSEEWPTPNVLATSHQHPSAGEAGATSLHPDSFSQAIDLPPPYSECTGPKPSIQCEDPPPPYSDCYVSFINPKDGVPTARIMRRGEDENGSGSNIGSQEPNIASQEESRTNDEPQSGAHNVPLEVGENSSENQSVGTGVSVEAQNDGSNNENESNGSTNQDCVINIHEDNKTLQV